MEKKIYIQPKTNVIELNTDDYCDFIPVSGYVEADAKKKKQKIDLWEFEEEEEE